MFQCKLHSQDVIKSELTLQVIVELNFLELLREEQNDSQNALRIIAWHQEMALSLETSQVALSQESRRERQILALTISGDIRHHCNKLQACISIFCNLVYRLQSELNLTWRIILVQIDHLHLCRASL